MGTKLIWMPDTSALNRLADDSDVEALIGGLRAAYFVRFPFTVVSEIIANTSGDRRRTLLRVCRRLLAASGDCIEPSHEIIRTMVARFDKGLPTNVAVYVRMHEAEIEILREIEFSDDFSTQERNENRKHDKQFAGLFADAKAAFNSAGVTRPTSLSDLIEHLQKGGAFWNLVQNLYNRATPTQADEATAKKFYAVCEPFRALMISLFVTQYARCFPTPGEHSMKTGRNDTFMAAALPYCDEFITDDLPQLRAYRAVVKYMGLNVTIRSFDEFIQLFAITSFPKAS
jgi:hypothetical protein